MIRIIFSLSLSIVLFASNIAAAQTPSAPPALADNAPDTYTIVKGDTLWGISAKFLQQPWRWPEVWKMNREQIHNPHLIYPGQIVMLDRSGPWLSIGHQVGGNRNVKLSPQIYSESLNEALPSIPLSIISPFLTKPLIIDNGQLDGSATIVATEVSRVAMGAGDTIFAKNVKEGVKTWQIYRPARALEDPVTRKTIAYEANYLGSARLIARENPEAREPATLEIITANEEISIGDLMLPSEEPQVFAFVPHAPEQAIEARLISIHRGINETGRLNVVALSAGKEDGLEPGHVLAMYRDRGNAVFRENNRNETFNLPEKRYGMAFVFRVFNHISYALIMDTDGQASVGDVLRNP